MTAPEILKRNWLQILILALPFAVLAAFWSTFPPRVASHWNIHGHPDGWMNKGPGLLLLPVMNLGMCALFVALPHLDPKIRANREPGRMREVLGKR